LLYLVYSYFIDDRVPSPNVLERAREDYPPSLLAPYQGER